MCLSYTLRVESQKVDVLKFSVDEKSKETHDLPETDIGIYIVFSYLRYVIYDNNVHFGSNNPMKFCIIDDFRRR